MTESFFEKNLQSLQSRYPDYAEALLAHPAADPVEMIQPDEVRLWLANAMSHPVEQVVLLGTRGGYAIDILLREYNLRNLVVIEKEFGRFRQVMHNVDLSRAILNPHVFWVIGYAPEDLEEGIEYCKTSLAAVGFQLLQDPYSWREFMPYYVLILRELKRVIDDETFSLRARLARGPLVQRNLISNMPLLLRANVLDEVQNRFAQVPAIVVAAGPSLDKNVRELLRLNGSALIICVDTALKTLNKHGIKPHIVVTSDPTQDNAAHFENVQWPDGAVFAFAPDCYYSIPRQYAGVPQKICLYDDSARITYRLRAMLPFRCFMDRPMHVGESAIRLALMMGCDPIIFAGLDLALPSDYSATHAESSARACRILSRSAADIQVELPNGKTVTHTLISVPGVHGEPVQTFYSFKMYLDQLEDLIESNPIRWIDATEGGAVKKGSDILSLHKVVDRLNRRRDDVALRLHEIPPPSKNYLQTCIPWVRMGIRHLQMMKSQLSQIIDGAINETEAAQIWAHFLADEETRSFLDHAVFQFQVYPRIHQMPLEKRLPFLQARAKEAVETIALFLPVWEEALQRMTEKDPQWNISA